MYANFTYCVCVETAGCYSKISLERLPSEDQENRLLSRYKKQPISPSNAKTHSVNECAFFCACAVASGRLKCLVLTSIFWQNSGRT